MDIFIAGATGLLGRGVVRRLATRGHRVRALSRSPENQRLIRELGAEPAAGDLFDMRGLARVVEGAEAVLHLATKIPPKVRPTFRDFAENDRIRTEGTVKLVEAARLAGARLYVQQSIAFLAATNDARLLADEDPCRLPAPQGSPQYAAAKMEEIVRHAEGRDGLRTMILRGGAFYHHESLQTRQLVAAVRRRMLPIFGSGDNIVSPIHAEDMAEAVVAALERPAPGETFFVVDDGPLSFRDYVGTIARLLGAPPPRRLPQFLARPLLGPILGLLPSISFNCSNEKLRRATGWRPRFPDFAAGMAEVVLTLREAV